MPRRGSPYGGDYPRRRAALLAVGAACWLCGRPAADSVDHCPPVSSFPPGGWRGRAQAGAPGLSAAESDRRLESGQRSARWSAGATSGAAVAGAVAAW